MSVFGFKEWKLVCDAMERGEQSILLRKGGISEGKHGFQWLHREFFLFPTYFHEQSGRLRLSVLPDGQEVPSADADKVSVRLFATLEETWEIDNLKRALDLRPLHVWEDEVIQERFGYGDGQGISLALVRVYHLAEPWDLANRAAFGGCRSWLGLPQDEGLAPDWRRHSEPVLDTEAFHQVRDQLNGLLQ